MRESLKNLFSNFIILENDAHYRYSIKPYELTNALGNVVALLQQYHFLPIDGQSTATEYKLYKTKEGNWYDFENTCALPEKAILRMLKSTIDKKEAIEISKL